MKKILVLGAGHCSPALVDQLLKQSQQHDWFVTLGDQNRERAQSRIGRHERGTAIEFNVNDTDLRASQIEEADLLINLLPPPFQPLLAVDCVSHHTNMISASYEDQTVRDLSSDATRHGVLILTEVGFDPGVDHMTAVRMIGRLHDQGARIKSFKSYGGALPDPASCKNPLRYAVTWNPRNVVMAGSQGAAFLEQGKVKLLPYGEVFQKSWRVDVEGIGAMEAYPNRDSLHYRDLYGLNEAQTLVRATLRYPSFCEIWQQIVRLGIPNEFLDIPDLDQMTFAEFTEMFLPTVLTTDSIRQRAAAFLRANPTGTIMEGLEWLGLFGIEKIGTKHETPAEVLAELISKKLALTSEDRDMVILQHEIEAEYPDGHSATSVSLMIEYGERGGLSAIARGVGLPAAVCAQLLLTDQLPLTGSHIPSHDLVAEKALAELEKLGFRVQEFSA